MKRFSVILAVALLLGLVPVAEAGAGAVLAAYGQADGRAMTILFLVVVFPFFVYGCYLQGKRKHEKELAERMNPRSQDVTVRHEYYGLPFGGHGGYAPTSAWANSVRGSRGGWPGRPGFRLQGDTLMQQVLFASASDILVGGVVGVVGLFIILYVIGKREMERKAREKADQSLIELRRQEPVEERVRYTIIRFRTWWFE